MVKSVGLRPPTETSVPEAAPEAAPVDGVVGYVLAGLRALVSGGWDVGAIGGALAATAIVGTVSIGLALAALRRRVRIP